MNNIITPYVELSVTFDSEQETICRDCYKEVSNIMDKFKPDYHTRNYVKTYELEPVDYCMEGWCFNICISLQESEMLQKITEKLIEYSR